MGLEKTVHFYHALQCVLGFGDFRYTSRPVSEAWQNNTGPALYSGRKVYIKNFHPGGTPQLVAGVGYRYNSTKHWFMGLNLNYFDKIYTELNPDKRTVESLGKYTVNEIELVQETAHQEQLPHYYLLNASCGKTFTLAKKTQLTIHLSVNNLLNTKDVLVAGAEQFRWDPQFPGRFASKYTYFPGITYMTNLSFNF